jgi:hypothetical protein
LAAVSSRSSNRPYRHQRLADPLVWTLCRHNQHGRLGQCSSSMCIGHPLLGSSNYTPHLVGSGPTPGGSLPPQRGSLSPPLLHTSSCTTPGLCTRRQPDGPKQLLQGGSSKGCTCHLCQRHTPASGAIQPIHVCQPAGTQGCTMTSTRLAPPACTESRGTCCQVPCPMQAQLRQLSPHTRPQQLAQAWVRMGPALPGICQLHDHAPVQRCCCPVTARWAL